MATLPRYGGSNGVSELDLGQPGGARASALEARYVVKMEESGEETRIHFNAVPQIPGSFVDIQAPLGRTFQWTGTLKVDSLATLAAIRSDLHKAKHGHALTASGTYGSFDLAAVQPTQLLDFGGTTISTAAKVTDFRFGEIKRITASDFMYLLPLTVTFRTLR